MGPLQDPSTPQACGQKVARSARQVYSRNTSWANTRNVWQLPSLRTTPTAPRTSRLRAIDKDQIVAITSASCLALSGFGALLSKIRVLEKELAHQSDFLIKAIQSEQMNSLQLQNDWQLEIKARREHEAILQKNLQNLLRDLTVRGWVSNHACENTVENFSPNQTPMGISKPQNALREQELADH